MQGKAVDRPLPPPIEGGEGVFVSVQRLCQELFVGLLGQQRHLGDTADVVSISVSPGRAGKFRRLSTRSMLLVHSYTNPLLRRNVRDRRLQFAENNREL